MIILMLIVYTEHLFFISAHYIYIDLLLQVLGAKEGKQNLCLMDSETSKKKLVSNKKFLFFFNLFTFVIIDLIM